MPAPGASGWSGRRVGLAPTGKAPPCHGARGHAGHLEMAHSLIFTRLLKIIYNRHAENPKRPGKPAFPDFQCHFHEQEGGLDCWTSRASRSRVEASSDEARAVVSHPVEPAPPISPRSPYRPSPAGFAEWVLCRRNQGCCVRGRAASALGRRISRSAPAYAS
jgi:hypothetical protein